jgi:hypothetical protein
VGLTTGLKALLDWIRLNTIFISARFAFNNKTAERVSKNKE